MLVANIKYEDTVCAVKRNCHPLNKDTDVQKGEEKKAQPVSKSRDPYAAIPSN